MNQWGKEREKKKKKKKNCVNIVKKKRLGE